MLEMPLAVSTLVGNQTARAMRKALAETTVGKLIIARGIQAVEGMGPSTRTRG